MDLRWLWLLIGFALLPFTAYRVVIPLAAWIAPVFLLRFERVSRRGGPALWLIFAAYTLAGVIDLIGIPGPRPGPAARPDGLPAVPCRAVHLAVRD